MFKVEPYLMFDGNCREAFDFYRSVFGGEFCGMFQFKDAPKEIEVKEADRDRIMHMALPIGQDTHLMGSDIGHGMPFNPGDNIHLSLSIDDIDKAKRIYKELSTGGKIIMPLEKTFWAELYALFTDKFGINWMINCKYIKCTS